MYACAHSSYTETLKQTKTSFRTSLELACNSIDELMNSFSDMNLLKNVTCQPNSCSCHKKNGLNSVYVG